MLTNEMTPLLLASWLVGCEEGAVIIRLDLSGLPPVAEWDAADPPGEWEGLGCASRPVDQVEIWNPARGLPAEFVCAEE